MARIRTVKPEIRDDVKLAKTSRDARLTFVLLITAADDDGLVLATPRRLVGELYPHDEDITPAMVRAWCDELANVGAVRWRETQDGQSVLQLVNWDKHQNIKHRAKPVLANLLKASPDAPETVPSVSGNPPEDRGRMAGASPPPTKHLAPYTNHPTPSTSTKHQERVDAASTHHCVLLAAAANRGMSEAMGGIQEPVVHSTGHALVRDLAEAEVPLDFALERVYARSLAAKKIVRSLSYFTASVLEDWERECARQLATADRPVADALGETAMFVAMARRQAAAGQAEFVSWCTERGVDFASEPSARERIA